MAPTPAPTPCPTPEPTPAPTPEPVPEEAANTFLGGPISGAPAPPTFRLLVAQDLPADVTFDNVTVNNTLNVLGQIIDTNLSPNDIVWTSADSALTTTPGTVSQNQFYAGPFLGGPSPASWRVLNNADIPTVLSGQTIENATILTALVNDSLIYQSTCNDCALSGGTTNTGNTITNGTLSAIALSGGTNNSGNTIAGGTISGSTLIDIVEIENATMLYCTINSSIFYASTWNGGTISGATLSGTTTLSGLAPSSVLWTDASNALTTTGAAQSANTFYAGPTSGVAAAPTWRSIVDADLPALVANITVNGTVNVTSLTVTSLSTNSMVWTDGTSMLTSTASAQTANAVYAGPASGPAGAPTFRSLVLPDLPAQTGTGSIVLNTGPTISGATLSGTTTLNGLSSSSILWTDGSSAITTTAAAQSPNLFYAGPSSGAASAPTWRAITSADLPPVISNITLNGTVTVTSLTDTGLSINSLVWTDGTKTLTSTAASQSPNLVYAGPAAAPAGAPTFRSLVLPDLPAQTGTGNIVLATGPSISGATLGGTTTLSALSTNSIVWTDGSSAATTTAASQSAKTFYAGPTSGSAAAPTWRAIASADLPPVISNVTLNGTVTVTSLIDTGLSANSIVWTDASKTLTSTTLNESPNTFYAGPGGTPSAPPSFRTLVVGDLPARTGTGNVVLATTPTLTNPTLAGVSVIVSSLTASSIIWTDGSGAMTSTGASQTANTFYASPAPSPGVASFRAIVTADLPPLPGNCSISGTLSVTSLTVTGLASNSIVWTDGTKTLTSTGAPTPANQVFAGPAAAPAAAPTFRSLVLADLPTQTGTGNIVLATSPTLVTPALGTPTSGNLASCTAYPANQVVGSLVQWTPSMGDGTNLVTTNSPTVGTYKYITADQMWVAGRVTWVSKGSCSGNVRLFLPFTSNNFGSVYRYPCWLGALTGVNTSVVGQVTTGIDAGNAYTWLLKSTAGVGAVAQFSDLANNGEIQFGCMYPL